MKTAVSLPDDIFERADKLARRTKRSRSRLFCDALKEYISRHAPDDVTDAMNRVVADLNEKGDDFVRIAANRILERSEW